MAILYFEKKIIFFGATVVVLAFVVGVMIGSYSNDGTSQDSEMMKIPVADRSVLSDEEMIDSAINDVSTDNLREYLKNLTKEPHIAGQKRDKELIKWIRESWESFGFDTTETAEYDFLLSWPNQTNPNKIYLLDKNGTIKFTSKHKEEEIRKGDDHPNFVHAFNAYAPAGDVEGQLVYVNYGRIEDLKELEDLAGEDFLKGKICIARYGKIFRGNKVRNCQDKGAIGVILFTDPENVAPLGTEPKNVYPNTMFLPGSGIQRGTTYIGEGDPLSPKWPSVENAYRVEPEEVDGLPKIPAQPIGYDDAKQLIEKLGGMDSPKSWKGGIDAEYKIGGSFKSPWEGWKVRLKVNNYRGTVKSSNVIGYIRGEVEPDRYVILSNHRDAWGYGSVDPSSGTAQLMEVTRVLGQLKANGWRPRRTLVFCSWASEEYGYEGSYEWVYHHLSKLMHRTVGLVNTDICVAGPIVNPQASPMLRDVFVNALKAASNPTNSSHRSYYDFWKKWTNQDNNGEEIEPKVGYLGSGTDHAAFAFYAGIPALNYIFQFDRKKYKIASLYPTYHTGYETFHLIDKIVDPDFKIHKTCAQTTIHALMELAESTVLPYNVEQLPKEMKNILESFDKANYTKKLNDNGVTLEHIEKAIDDFANATAKFRKSVEEDKTIRCDPMRLRMINDQMMQLERVFVMDGGLPERPDTRHAVFAPGKYNKYGGAGFPAIPDLLYESEKLVKGTPEHKKRWNTIKQHVSDLMIMIQSAARFLKPLHEI